MIKNAISKSQGRKINTALFSANEKNSISRKRKFSSKIQDHPWIKSHFHSSSHIISHTDRILTFVSANTAHGNLSNLSNDFHFLIPKTEGEQKKNIVDQVEQVLLQTHLVAGIPRTINAFATLQYFKGGENEPRRQEHEGAGLRFHEKTEKDLGEWNLALKTGHRVAESIYGERTLSKLRSKIFSLSPALDRCIMEHGYGQILSQPGLTLLQRELCNIAALAGMNVSPQLVSHIRGALRLGATREQIRSLLDQTFLIFGKEAQEQADSVWLTYERARGAL